MFAVSSGPFKLCLINVGLAWLGKTSRINASAAVAWKCTLLRSHGAGATSRQSSVCVSAVEQCPSESR